MSGSRFHPYGLEEGANSGRTRNAPGRSVSATATTSHKATSSVKMLSQSTPSADTKPKRLMMPNQISNPVPRNETAPTASASCQADFTLVSTPTVSRQSGPNAVSSQPPIFEAIDSLAAPSFAKRPTPPTALASRPPPTPSIASRPDPTTTMASGRLRGTSNLGLAPLPGDPLVSGLPSYPYWSLAQRLYAVEHQRRIHLQQQMWLQQQNMAYMAGGCQQYQEYIRYVNELRHMSVLPFVPASAAQLSYFSPMQDQPLNLSLKDNGRDWNNNSGSSNYASNKTVISTTKPVGSLNKPIGSSNKPVASSNKLVPSSNKPVASSNKMVPPSNKLVASSSKLAGSVDCFSPERPQCPKDPSPKSSSPPSLKLHPTKPIQDGSLDPEVAKMFPHLRTTDLGSIVLWNFLWALLADNNHKGIIRWIDRPSLKFQVVHPLALATYWGNVKKNRTMNWQKLMKVINLYVSKNILKQGEDKLEFQFILVPQPPDVKAVNGSSV